MKLIVAVVQDYDAQQLLGAITQAGFRATRIGSTGGFLRVGNTTVIMGVDDHHVGRALRIIEANGRERTETVQPEIVGDIHEWYPPELVEVVVGGANVFVLNVERFERL
ncbi:MAG TPA: cyclic-di-AMP receptor [Thermomicrobiaceae bacterium]|nr:cyclic-di-AMP receptor [Thermomicrobiaceae bacterium]